MSKAKNIQKKVIQDSDEDSSSQLPLIQTKKEQIKAKKDTKKVQPQSSEEDQTPVVKAKNVKVRKASKASMDEEDQPIQKKPVKTVTKKVVKKQSSSQESQEQVVKKPTKSPVQKALVTKKVAKKQSSSEESSQDEQPKKKVAKSPAQKPVATKKAAKKQSSQDESSQQVKPTKKSAKSPVQKAIVSKKKPVQQNSEQSSSQQAPKKKVPVKSPVQKPIVSKKKKQQSQDEEQQVKAPIRKVSKDSIKVTKKVQTQEPYEQCQICVQGLSFNAFDSDIRALFQPCGQIVHVNLLMRPDGKPKGTAFVKFNKKSSLNKALQLNETEHLGRQIRVQQARGKQGGQQGGFNKRQQGGARNGGKSFENNAVIQTPTLFIGGLSYQSTNDSIRDFFTQIGQVQSARVVTDKQTGNPRGFGYVQFYDVETAKKAYASLNGANLDGRNIRLDSAAQRDRPQNGGNRGSFGGGSGGFGGSGFGGGNRGPSRNPGNSTVILSQDDKNAKKGAIGTFQGKKIAL